MPLGDIISGLSFLQKFFTDKAKLDREAEKDSAQTLEYVSGCIKTFIDHADMFEKFVIRREHTDEYFGTIYLKLHHNLMTLGAVFRHIDSSSPASKVFVGMGV
jgi:hypothetical protein